MNEEGDGEQLEPGASGNVGCTVPSEGAASAVEGDNTRNNASQQTGNCRSKPNDGAS